MTQNVQTASVHCVSALAGGTRMHTMARVHSGCRVCRAPGQKQAHKKQKRDMQEYDSIIAVNFVYIEIYEEINSSVRNEEAPFV